MTATKPAGEPWSAAERLSDASLETFGQQPAMDPRGDVTLVWNVTVYGPEEPPMPPMPMGSYIQSASRSADEIAVETEGVGAGAVRSEPAGIDCSGSCFRWFGEGASVRLTAEPASGSVFEGWSGRLRRHRRMRGDGERGDPGRRPLRRRRTGAAPSGPEPSPQPLVPAPNPPSSTPVPASSGPSSSTSGGAGAPPTSRPVCRAARLLTARAVPRVKRRGPAMSGVRARLRVSSPAWLQVVPILGYRFRGRPHRVRLPRRSLHVDGARGLRLGLPRPLRRRLRLGARVHLNLRVRVTPDGGTACAAHPTRRVVHLRTRVVKVLRSKQAGDR